MAHDSKIPDWRLCRRVWEKMRLCVQALLAAPQGRVLRRISNKTRPSGTPLIGISPSNSICFQALLARRQSRPALVRAIHRTYDSALGLTHVTTTIRRLAGHGKGLVAEFLVDTAAADCLGPAKALHKAGINREGKNVYELADGSFEIKRP
jgi:hypothetical protein